MGLDIHIKSDKDEEIITFEYLTDKQNLKKQHQLSREFCNLMCRKDVVEHLPELEQIEKYFDIDFSTIYQMENYPTNEYVESILEYEAKTEDDKNNIILKVNEDRLKLENNIFIVENIIENTILKLSIEDNLVEKLIKTDFDTLNYKYYFSDFNIDKGDGYIRNNFGQDLRNFKRYLEYIKAKGAKTIWFEYM